MKNPTVFPWHAKQTDREDRQLYLFPELRRSFPSRIPEPGIRTDGDEGFMAERYFQDALRHERKRTERTGDPFVLALIDVSGLYESVNPYRIETLCETIQAGARDTDIAGWYSYPEVLGVIFTALQNADRRTIKSALFEKIAQALGITLSAQETTKVVISFHFFPEDYGNGNGDFQSDKKLYPDLTGKSRHKKLKMAGKRLLDIIGSLFAMILFSPFFVIIPILIKFTSKGPVFFKQQRIGMFGRKFSFLKFRSMTIDNDDKIHKEYVRKLIGQSIPPGDKKRGVFKIVNDPRVTPLGRILRKTSLDEIPQFYNVLKGDMSLVGPRPPIPYELAHYRHWHRRRVVEVRPGITGLWQVMGRSKTTFDEMVRLDLQYIKKQSLWLDLKIILRTPSALISGNGAY
jgi:lipopolysaccharide/colanic/teichoic acid biosynthesis glycosyltransferase